MERHMSVKLLFAYVMNTSNDCVSVLLTRLHIAKLMPNKIVPLWTIKYKISSLHMRLLISSSDKPSLRISTSEITFLVPFSKFHPSGTNPHQNTENGGVRKPRKVILAKDPATMTSSNRSFSPPTAVSGHDIMLLFLPIHETQGLKQWLGID